MISFRSSTPIILEASPSSTSEENTEEKLSQLVNMFPDRGYDEMKELLESNNYDINSTVDDIVLSKPIFEKQTFDDLDEAHAFFVKKLKGDVYRLNVENNSVYMDMVGFYKSSRFDPERPLKIKMVPAADYGGVLKQCFTSCFEEFKKLWFYECEIGYYLPIYKPNIFVTKLFTILGKMIGHSIMQDGPGFAVFSPSVYFYIVHGRINETIPMSPEDIADAKRSYAVSKVL